MGESRLAHHACRGSRPPKTTSEDTLDWNDPRQLAIVARAAADVIYSYPDAAVHFLRIYASVCEDLEALDRGDELPDAELEP